MLIYLLRHGQTTGDLEDRFGGDYDDHLSDEGKQQAQNLSDKLINSGIQVLFCSPRIRAQETATYINSKLNVPIETIGDFRERNHYGILTGMVKSEAKEKYPELVALLNDTKNTIDGGEDYEVFKKRVDVAWSNILNQNYDTIAIITHGGPIRHIFRDILKQGEIKIDDCAYSIIEVKKGSNPTVISLNGIFIQ